MAPAVELSLRPRAKQTHRSSSGVASSGRPILSDIRAALQSDLLSMPAGELGMLVGIAPGLMAACEARGIRVTHLICMTDSIATRAAVNHNSSPSPQLT